jgi:hypothetical protein
LPQFSGVRRIAPVTGNRGFPWQAMDGDAGTLFVLGEDAQLVVASN